MISRDVLDRGSRGDRGARAIRGGSAHLISAGAFPDFYAPDARRSLTWRDASVTPE